jgi:hypothetical protein
LRKKAETARRQVAGMMTLYLMAAAMFLGAWLVHLLPRNASIDEAEHAPAMGGSPVVGDARGLKVA